MERDVETTPQTADENISTHTLTWSVTENLWTGALLYAHFNSHAHVERDVATTLLGGGRGNFNSHAHVERDVATTLLGGGRGNFNSHAHVERD